MDAAKKDELVEGMVTQTHVGFDEWKASCDVGRRVALLFAGLTISLRDPHKAQGFVDDMLTLAHGA